MTGNAFANWRPRSAWESWPGKECASWPSSIPLVGAAAGAALAGASTYALGRAFCYYYQAVHEGHVPDAQALKKYFERELAEAKRFWSKQTTGQSVAEFGPT